MGARGVNDAGESPRRRARRPLGQRDRRAQIRGRRGDIVERRLDRVLRRHGDYGAERERSGVTPMEASDQLGLGIAPEQLAVKGDERLGARLPGKAEPIESC